MNVLYVFSYLELLIVTSAGSPTVLIIIASLSILLLLATIVIVVFVVKSKRRKRKKILEQKKKISAGGKMKTAPSEELWVAQTSKNEIVREESEDHNKYQVYYDPTYDYME